MHVSHVCKRYHGRRQKYNFDRLFSPTSTNKCGAEYESNVASIGRRTSVAPLRAASNTLAPFPFRTPTKSVQPSEWVTTQGCRASTCQCPRPWSCILQADVSAPSSFARSYVTSRAVGFSILHLHGRHRRVVRVRSCRQQLTPTYYRTKCPRPLTSIFRGRKNYGYSEDAHSVESTP